jgi:hypothetical protein
MELLRIISLNSILILDTERERISPASNFVITDIIKHFISFLQSIIAISRINGNDNMADMVEGTD